MINHLLIENFKSIRYADICLRHLNVFIGCNGAGKSNFITVFELLRALYNQRLGAYMLECGGVERLLHDGLKHSTHIKCLFNFDDKNAFFFTLKPTVGNKAYIESSGDFYNQSGDTQRNYNLWNRKDWDNAVEESRISDATQYRAKYIKNFLNGFTVYHFHDTSRLSPIRSDCEIGDNEYLRHDASNLAAVLLRLQHESNRHFRLIEGVVRSVAPYFKCFRLRENPNKPGYVTLEWEDVTSDAYFDAYSLSDGTLRFVALATLLLQPVLPAAIIIDEPELGLHPTALNKFAALAHRASVKSQIILSTQSVNLVNNFVADDVIVVDRQDGQSVFRRLDSDSLSSWLEDYAIGEIWEKNVIGGQP